MGLFVLPRVNLTISFSMFQKFSTIISSKIFSYPFFFLDPYNLKVGAFDIVPEVSETILSSFYSFYFILLFRSYFHHFIFQLPDSFCFRYSALDSFSSIFNFSNCVCLCYLFFNSSSSLLIDSCIFSILFSRFFFFLLSLFWIHFQVVCLFSPHLFGLLCFIHSFICVVFLGLFLFFLTYCV